LIAQSEKNKNITENFYFIYFIRIRLYFLRPYTVVLPTILKKINELIVIASQGYV